MDEYTNQLINKNSPLLRRQEVTAIDFDTKFQVQSRNIRVSNVSVGNLINISGTADAVGTVAAGTHVVFTANITPGTGFAGKRVGGWAAQEIYEGTAVDANNLIFPAPGGNIAADRWRFSAGYRTEGGSEIDHRYQVMVYNNTGGALPVYGVAKWKYSINGGGTTA